MIERTREQERTTERQRERYRMLEQAKEIKTTTRETLIERERERVEESDRKKEKEDVDIYRQVLYHRVNKFPGTDYFVYLEQLWLINPSKLYII